MLRLRDRQAAVMALRGFPGAPVADAMPPAPCRGQPGRASLPAGFAAERVVGRYRRLTARLCPRIPVPHFTGRRPDATGPCRPDLTQRAWMRAAAGSVSPPSRRVIHCAVPFHHWRNESVE